LPFLGTPETQLLFALDAKSSINLMSARSLVRWSLVSLAAILLNRSLPLFLNVNLSRVMRSVLFVSSALISLSSIWHCLLSSLRRRCLGWVLVACLTNSSMNLILY
jgi:hypothetical protein